MCPVMLTPEALLELFEERSAIAEHEGRIPRPVAELRARLELVERYGPFARKVLEKHRLEKNTLPKGTLVHV